MINWINGQVVQVQTSINFEAITMRMNRIQKGTKQIELLDKYGKTKYFTNVDNVTFIVPEDIKELMDPGDKISQYFKFEEGDLV